MFWCVPIAVFYISKHNFDSPDCEFRYHKFFRSFKISAICNKSGAIYDPAYGTYQQTNDYFTASFTAFPEVNLVPYLLQYGFLLHLFPEQTKGL